MIRAITELEHYSNTIIERHTQPDHAKIRSTSTGGLFINGKYSAEEKFQIVMESFSENVSQAGDAQERNVQEIHPEVILLRRGRCKGQSVSGQIQCQVLHCNCRTPPGRRNILRRLYKQFCAKITLTAHAMWNHSRILNQVPNSI